MIRFSKSLRISAAAGIGVVAVSVALAAGALGGTKGPAQPLHGAATPAAAAPNASQMATLRAVGAELASANGDGAPTDAALYATTRVAAVAADGGATIDTDAPSYMVVLHGHFTGYGASIKLGASPPTGTALFFVVPASDPTHITDWGIAPNQSVLDTSYVGQASALGAVGGAGQVTAAP